MSENSIVSVDEVDYHAMPGVSNSSLSDYLADVRLYYHKHVLRDLPRKSKDYFDFGTAVHELTLLGTGSNIVQIPSNVLASDGSKRGNKWKEFEQENDGKILMKPADFAAVRQCVDSLFLHPVASHFLGLDGVCEKPVYVRDDVLGLDMRCKPDKLLTNNVVLDLKTTSGSSTAEHFVGSVANYGYYRQEYFYKRVLRMAGVDVKQFVFIVVSTDPPHTVDCFTLDSEAMNGSDRTWMQYAESEVEPALSELAERYVTYNWLPKNHHKVTKLQPPNWLKYKGQYAA